MRRKVVSAILACAVLGGVALSLRGQWSIEELAGQEQQLRQVIETRPWQSTAAGLGIYFLASLVPGTTGKAIAFGWLFGMWRGALIVNVGLTAAALTSFVLSRYFLRDMIESRIAVFQRRLNAALLRDGAFYLLTLRMMHVPFTFLNYSAGVSRVGWSTFGWTTFVGLLPGTLVFVFLGTRLPTLSELAHGGLGHLLSPWLWVALIGTGLLPFITRSLARGMRRCFSRQTDAAQIVSQVAPTQPGQPNAKGNL